MARLTPQELQAARRRRQEERAEAERRMEEEAMERAREVAEQERHEEDSRQQYEILTTVADSLYDELDKLTKKAPKETVTDLALEKVNELIRDTKAFLNSDPYLKGIVLFEAAGDNPEYRDALLVVGQLRAALRRYRSRKKYDWSSFR